MSARTRPRHLVVSLCAVAVNAACWVVFGWGWWPVGIACGVLAAAMAVARPYVVGPDSDAEAGEGGRR